MIPKTSIPIQITQPEQVKPLNLKFGNYANTVAIWNPTIRQWGFGNGQTINCNVFAGNTSTNIETAEE